MTNYSPNAPDVAGMISWAPDKPIASAVRVTPAPVAILDSHASEAITEIHLPVQVASGVANIVCDIYDSATLVPQIGAARFLAAPAAEDATIEKATTGTANDGWIRDDGSTTNYFSRINDLILDSTDINDTSQPWTQDWLTLRDHDTTRHARFRAQNGLVDFSTGAAFPGVLSARIFSISIRVICSNIDPNTDAGVGGELVIGGVLYTQPAEIVPAGGGMRARTWTWTYNPATGVPWHLNDINLFLAGGSGEWGFRAHSGGTNSSSGFRVFAAQLEIEMFPTDQRLATAYGSIGTSAGGSGGIALPAGSTGSLTPSPWRRFTIRNPSTGAPTSWAKQNNRKYAIVVHKPTTNALAGWRGLDTSGGSALTGIGTLTGHRSGGLRLYSVGNGIPYETDGFGNIDFDKTSAAHGIVLYAGGSPSVDSQAYVGIVEATVDATHSASQEINNQGTFTYGNVAVRCKPFGFGKNLTTAPLQLSLRRKADASLLAGPLSIDGADLEPVTNDWHLVEQRFSVGAALTAGDDVYVDIHSGTASSAPWKVAYLTTLDQFYNAITYGGVAAVGTHDGTRDVTSDALVAIKTIPTAPSALDAAIGALTNLFLGSCSPPLLFFASLDWGSTTLGGKFASYELQRNDDGVWRLVAQATQSEGNSFFNDFESLRNSDVAYRVRVVRTDGAFSDWSTFGNISVPSGEADVLIVSNENPTRCVALQDQTPHEYAHADAAGLVTVPLYGRDGFAGFRPTERRGDHFTKQVYITINDPNIGVTIPKGRKNFDPILGICHDPALPYVCVLDGDGNRWYAFVNVNRSVRTEPLGRYEAEIEVTEATFEPFVTGRLWTPTFTPGLTMGADGGGSTFGDANGTFGTV